MEYAWYGQNNGNTKKLRNIIYVGCIERTSFGSIARVSALVIVSSDSLCEGLKKYETCCSIWKEGSLFVGVH
jgi:hypothetical protein